MMLLKEIKMYYNINVSLPHTCSGSRNVRRKREGKQFSGNPFPVGVILFVGDEQSSTVAARSKPRSVFDRGFEFCLSHGCRCTFFLLFCVVVHM
jgi:hypothetical protein